MSHATSVYHCTHSSPAAHISVLCCIGVAVLTQRYSVLIHHSTLVIPLWTAPHITPPSTALILLRTGANFALILLTSFSSDRALTTPVQLRTSAVLASPQHCCCICTATCVKLAQIANCFRAGTCLGSQHLLHLLPGLAPEHNCSPAAVSALAVALACSNPPAYPATAPVLSATDCAARNRLQADTAAQPVYRRVSQTQAQAQALGTLYLYSYHSAGGSTALEQTHIGKTVLEYIL